MATFIEQTEQKRKREQRQAEIALKNKRLGMSIFQISWIMVFIALVVVNWQLRFSYAEWPPAGIEAFSPILPTIATVALLVSMWLARNGLKVLMQEHIPAFMNNWRLAIALGIVFMAIIAFEFITVSAQAMTTHYGVTLRLMTGFHFTHALVILGMMVYVYQQAQKDVYTGDEHDSWQVEGTAKLWYFVTVAWLLFYIVLYWIT